ncbi:MAG: hypothetical protein Q7J06_09410 [Bacteroidales bacterium]|nr:hypothetical protein [Bacteroidales bacterium]
MRILICNLIIILLLVSFSCKPGPVEKETFKPVFSTYKSDSTGTLIPKEKNEIFYGILTPVEVCAIFNRLGVPYDNAILNPISRRDEYLSSSKASINTGIYGVDFGYLKIFGIGQELIDYMMTIREMSNKLGIAEQKYTLTSLFSFLKNYYDDPVVVYYTKKLKFLQSYFDTFDIYFKKGDLEIDTTKQVLLSSGSEMTVTVETLNNIRDYVLKLRTEMVTPLRRLASGKGINAIH